MIGCILRGKNMAEHQFRIQGDGGELVSYLYSNYSAFVGKGLISICPNYQYPSHWHDDLEIGVVVNGEMQYNVNGEIETIREGEAFFINSRQLHSNYSENRTECEYICILLHPLLLCVNPVFEREFVAPLLGNEQVPYVKITNEIPWQKEILEEILAIYAERNDSVAPLLIQAHLYKIWAGLFKHVSRGEYNGQHRANRGNLSIIKNMVGYIQEHYQEKISLAEIAASGAVGQSKCCKLFKNYMNVTPNAYLNQFRLNKSRELLHDTELSITEIAEAVGFGGASYYAESFHKYYGESPSEYRDNVKSCVEAEKDS